MTDRTITVTIEQIRDIYNAGRRRGEEEATSYNCGSTCTGGIYDNCIDIVEEIVNDGIDWHNPDYINCTSIKEWFK